MRCIVYSPYWLRTILSFVVKSASYIRTQAWGFRRCSFRQLGRCQSLYTVERVTGLAPRFCLYISTSFNYCHIGAYGCFFIRLIMKKNEKNDELQSRREFFKKAAKGVLPILGLCILPSSASAMLHNVTKEMSPKDCNNNCSYNCTYGCRTSCNISCSGGCSHLCTRSCKVSCADDCNVTCENYCDSSCRGGCNLTCLQSCRGGCSGYCSYGCAGTMALF